MIEYCKFHTETHTDDEKKNFDTDFVKVDQATLFELILVRRSLWHARYREEACSRSSRPRKIVPTLTPFRLVASLTSTG